MDRTLWQEEVRLIEKEIAILIGKTDVFAYPIVMNNLTKHIIYFKEKK